MPGKHQLSFHAHSVWLSKTEHVELTKILKKPNPALPARTVLPRFRERLKPISEEPDTEALKR